MDNELIKVGTYNNVFNDILGINISESEIFMSKGLPAHMLKRHHEKCLKYIDYIPDIIKEPDYIGINPHETEVQSIELIKRYNDNILIGIKLDKDKYVVSVGDTITITPEILPSTAKNTNYTITSQNTDIVTVQGKELKAQKEGEAIVTFKTEDGGYTAQATIVVTKKLEDIYVDDSLKVENDVISKIDLNNNTVSDIKNKITTKYDMNIVNIDGKALEDSEKVGTGTKIQFLDGSDIAKEYTIIVYGDVDGSGTINARDLLMLQRYLLGKVQIKEIQVKAAIIDKVSQLPKAADLLKIQRHILGKYTIEQ